MPYVFVYGPDSLQSRIYDRLGPSDAFGGAALADHALTFDKPPFRGDKGAANLKASPGSTVYGVLYDLTRKQIEQLAGYYGGYVSEDRTVSLLPLAEGQELPADLAARRPSGPVKASVYVSRRTKAGLAPDPTQLTATLAGALENGAPEEYVAALRALGAL
jgi:hypothetical protein